MQTMHLEFYKLKRDPFLLTPDPGFLHFAEPHRKALLAMSRAVVERKGFMVLTGAAGTGKTTLLNLALCWFSRVQAMSSALIVNPLLNREELLETILDEFEIPAGATTKPQRLHALHSHLLKVKNSGGTCILIIDEAHLLTPELLEEIRLLNNMDTFQGKLLQVIFSGQPELASVLLDPRLKALCQRIAVLAQLRPLTLEETIEYIRERLRAAGLPESSIFTPQAAAAILRCTGGVPRLINVLCDACLRAGAATQTSTIETTLVVEAASKLAVLKSTAESLSGLSIAHASDVPASINIVSAANGGPAIVRRLERGAQG